MNSDNSAGRLKIPAWRIVTRLRSQLNPSASVAERREIRTLAHPRASYFVASDGRTRVRRPRDVFTAVVGLLLISWALARSGSTATWETSLTEFVAASPRWVTGLLSLGDALSVIYAVVVTAASAFGGDERRSALCHRGVTSGRRWPTQAGSAASRSMTCPRGGSTQWPGRSSTSTPFFRRVSIH